MNKNLILTGLLAIFMGLAACENMSYSDEDAIMSYAPKLTTIVYDSCEYVIGVDSYRAVLSHKGNCKYCKQRREEEKHVEEFKKYVRNILSELARE